MKTPSQVSNISYETNCTFLSLDELNILMTGATRANKKIINSLLKKYCPEWANDLTVDFYNPCNYFKTNTHLIVVHSAIEYFFRYKKDD